MTNPVTYLSNPEHRAAAVKRLALSFAISLREEIGDKDYNEVRARNATDEYARFCASHDFCDANMVMFDAFNTEIGLDIDFDNDDAPAFNDDAAAIWNAAWDLARATYLTAASPDDAIAINVTQAEAV